MVTIAGGVDTPAWTDVASSLFLQATLAWIFILSAKRYTATSQRLDHFADMAQFDCVQVDRYAIGQACLQIHGDDNVVAILNLDRRRQCDCDERCRCGRNAGDRFANATSLVILVKACIVERPLI